MSEYENAASMIDGEAFPSKLSEGPSGSTQDLVEAATEVTEGNGALSAASGVVWLAFCIPSFVVFCLLCPRYIIRPLVAPLGHPCCPSVYIFLHVH